MTTMPPSPQIETGRWYGPQEIPGGHYHLLPGWSSTQVKKASRSIQHMLQRDEGISDALLVGLATHTLALEGPDVYQCTYAVEPRESWNARTKKGRELRDEWRTAAWKNGFTTITQEQDRLANAIACAVHAHPIAREFIEWGQVEMSRWYIDEETGLLCKLRADIRLPDRVVDLKTGQDAQIWPFRRAIKKFGYHTSAAHYLEGCDTQKEFWFIVVEKEPPYGVVVGQLDPTSIDFGREIRARGLANIKAYQETGEATGYPLETVVF